MMETSSRKRHTGRMKNMSKVATGEAGGGCGWKKWVRAREETATGNQVVPSIPSP